MSIGDVAEASGMPAKTIRYHEEIGPVRPDRRGSGYRDFAEADVHKLVFLNRARSLGLSTGECRTLPSLYEDRGRSSADVNAVAGEHLKRVERKTEELQGLHATLSHLVSSCHGEDRPGCTNMGELTGGARDA